MTREIVCFFQCFIIFLSCQAQESMGLSLDPKSGVYGIFLNPASSAYYPYTWHANVIKGHLYAHTDYAKVTNTSTWDILRNYNAIEIVGKPQDVMEGNNFRQLVFDRNGGEKNGTFVSSILWPGAIWEKSPHEMVGAYIKTSVTGSFFQLPEALGYYEVVERNNLPVELGKYTISYMAWTDLGLHYSRFLDKSTYESSSLGINARILLPHESAMFSSFSETTFNRNDKLYHLVGGFQYSSLYTFFENGSSPARFNGLGIAMDLGYQVRVDEYSFGVSLLDFGFASYFSNVSNVHITSTRDITYNSSHIIDEEDIVAIIEDVDQHLDTVVSDIVEEGSSYTLALPTALSIQYRRKLSDSWTLSAAIVQRIPMGKNHVKRPNSLAIIPRYNNQLLDVSLPINLHEYRYPTVGLSVRYWFLVIGSDNILSLIGRKDFSGTDLFVGIQLYPFAKAKRNNDVRCYRF